MDTPRTIYMEAGNKCTKDQCPFHPVELGLKWTPWVMGFCWENWVLNKNAWRSVTPSWSSSTHSFYHHHITIQTRFATWDAKVWGSKYPVCHATCLVKVMIIAHLVNKASNKIDSTQTRVGTILQFLGNSCVMLKLHVNFIKYKLCTWSMFLD